MFKKFFFTCIFWGSAFSAPLVQRIPVESSLISTQSQTADSKPRVSIITSLYDADEFIAGFLSDIVQQTIFDQCELIIINANSPGNEEPIIKQYMQKYPNILYKRLDADPGLYAVWNIAINMAQADLITNANLDDRRNPESLHMHAVALEQNPQVDLVYSDFLVTFEPNETFADNSHRYGLYPPEFEQELMHKCITGPQPMWRKSVHERCGYFDETFVSAGDFEMWNRAVEQGSLLLKVAGMSGLYYLNPKGLSTDNAKSELLQQEYNRVKQRYSRMWNMAR